MKLEYEGVFFIGWVIRFVIFQQVSDYRFKRIYLFTIPIIFTFVEYFFYDVVFWCEFFFLPIIVLFIKTKKKLVIDSISILLFFYFNYL